MLQGDDHLTCEWWINWFHDRALIDTPTQLRTALAPIIERIYAKLSVSCIMCRYWYCTEDAIAM